MLAAKVKEIRRFLEVDLWETKLSGLPKGRAWVYRQLRILTIAFSEYTNDKCAEKASALTYFSLLSIVPVVAMAFGVATAFGLEDFLTGELRRYFSGQQEVLEYTLQFAHSMLDGASGGLISGISSLFLIYAVLRLFNNIEAAFNDIWATDKSRSFQRKLADYMSVIILGPLILIISSTATVFITTQIENLTEQFELLGLLRPAIMFFIRLVPYTLIWILLFLIYLIFPNTKVQIKPAIVAGILAGTVYTLTQWGYINFQVGVSKYSAIYGSFAALPLFLVWLQLSWLIVLLGAEYAFAIQHADVWASKNRHLEMDHYTRKKYAMIIMKRLVDDFKIGQRTSFEDLDNLVDLPVHALNQICDELNEAGLISLISGRGEQDYYQPAMDIHRIDVFTVYNRLERLENSEDSAHPSVISQAIEEVDQSLKESKANRLLLDL